jgi:hypothetical protein
MIFIAQQLGHLHQLSLSAPKEKPVQIKEVAEFINDI